ncbi:MAG: hypothetical protein FJX52_14300 [Alphaproteobacteria bacterium]|nr:hypothetical protein [Alphaproteobacteria bacterium]
MFVRVDEKSRVELEEPNDFKRFHVEIPRSIDLAAAGRALAGTARLEDEKTAWVSEAALRAWPGGGKDQAWQANFDGMLAYARKKGWIEAATGAIRAHIEWK